MLWLPALAGDGQRGSRLPLAGESVSALLAMMLRASGARADLLHALAADESLRAWAQAAAGDQRSHSEPEALADWFESEGFERLSAPGGVTVALEFGATSRDERLLLAACERLRGDGNVLEHSTAEVLEAAKLEALAEFAAGAGHEMNNPLAVISGRAQLMLREETNPERRRDLAVIQQQALRVHEMIADLMLFARPPALQRQTIDAAALCERVRAKLTSWAKELGVRVAAEPVASCGTWDGDPVALEGAWCALGRNALEASRRGQEVWLGVGCDEQAVHLWVQDHGAEMPADALRHAREPYFSGRSAGRGLGLGLSKAWRIGTQHGGELLIESGAKGTRVTLVIPRAGSQESIAR
jgi:signal transduction histidine kinase